MFIKRDLARRILEGAGQMPVIGIVGPRQSGKSTLAKALFPNHTYVDMQDIDLNTFARRDPKGFLASFKNDHGIIIDEAQYAPELFSQIKVEADKDKRLGYYILSGSENFQLSAKISESLVGRSFDYTLLPLSIHELKSADLVPARAEDQIYKGFYPHLYQSDITPDDYYANYITKYVERDIRSIRNIENVMVFQKFIQLCALRVGTMIQLDDLATSCNINQATARSWLSLLKTCYILFELPSYHENLGKRITKSPKLYFYDVGLAAALAGVNKEVMVKKRDLYGALFENMIVIDIMKNYYARGGRTMFSFYRDSNKNEVDLVIEDGGNIIPVEIKASETMDKRFFDTALWFQEQTQSENPYVVYGGSNQQKGTRGEVLPWNQVERVVKAK